MKRKIRLITAGFTILLLTALIGIALAANTEVTFTWTVDGHAFSVQLDKKQTGEYILYLPGALRGQDPVLSVNQDTDMIWDGTAYRAGETVPVSQYAGQTVPVSFSGWNNSWKVSVMQGSAMLLSVQ